jgi:hypothetical protein
MRRGWMLIALLPLTGCVSEERTSLVGGNPFGFPANTDAVTTASYAPASKDTALRVLQAGQKLVAHNPQLGIKPLFATIGSPRLEIFHAEAASLSDKDAAPAPVVYITEGLVKRCASESDLSAVLGYELGRVVADRASKVNPEALHPDRAPPIRVPIGGQGAEGPDLTARAELANFEKRFPKNVKTVTPPDPRKVALSLLERAGYAATALEAVEPILREADNNVALERHITGGGTPTWSPE